MSAPQTHKPLVSVIIPCRNEADVIRRCLESVLAQEEPEGGLEVIIADGMSEDETREVIQRLTTRLRDDETMQKVESRKQKAESRKQKLQ